MGEAMRLTIIHTNDLHSHFENSQERERSRI